MMNNVLLKEHFHVNTFFLDYTREIFILNKVQVTMAFMYPFHAPSLPTKWDDPLWVHEIYPSMEHSLLATLEQKRTNQVC